MSKVNAGADSALGAVWDRLCGSTFCQQQHSQQQHSQQQHSQQQQQQQQQQLRRHRAHAAPHTQDSVTGMAAKIKKILDQNRHVIPAELCIYFTQSRTARTLKLQSEVWRFIRKRVRVHARHAALSRCFIIL